MKVTIDGMTFEGSEEEIERIVHKYRPVVVTGGNPSAQPHGSDWPWQDLDPAVLGLRSGRMV